MAVFIRGYKTIRSGTKTHTSAVMSGMYRREARKLDVELNRPFIGQGHMPLDIQLQNNRWKRRKGLSHQKR